MKKTRFLICTILLVALIVPFTMISTSAADEVSEWDGKSVTSGWYNDSETTLYINSADDLAAFIKSDKTFAGKTVVLNCDIIWNTGDASEWSLTNKPANEWTALVKFQGTFNGNGHYVSGIYSTATSKTGFFTEIHNASVNDLSIINSYFCAESIVGGIAGQSRANNTISGCYVDAYIHTTGSSGQSGGLIGQAYGNMNTSQSTLTITNCETRGVFTSDLGTNVGGMVGYAKELEGYTYNVNLTNCLSTATLSGTAQVGGMIGKADYANATFNTCYYNGDLYSWDSSNVGGVVGGFGGNATNNSFTLYVNKCYYNGNFYRGGGTNLASFYSIPTRVGGVLSKYINIKVSGETKSYTTAFWGKINTSSKYYTDSENDNSAERSSSMAGFGTHTQTTIYGQVSGVSGTYSYWENTSPINKSGGLSSWLALSDVKKSFTTDAYGNVRLNSLPTMSHDCAAHYGEWMADGEGQKRVCTYGNCVKVDTRELSFELIEASSVRYEDPAGIRFLTKVNKNAFFKELYTGNDNSYTFSGANVTFGTLILPVDMLDGEELTVENSKAVNIVAKKIFNFNDYVQTADTFYYTAVLANFPDSMNTYDRALAARSYAKYELNGEVVYEYSDTFVNSLYDAAEDVYPNVGESVKSGLNMMLAKGAVNKDFDDENPDKVLMLENATPALFDEYAAWLASKGFTEHTNYEYSDNKFGLYHNRDYVVTFQYNPKTVNGYVEPSQKWYAYDDNNEDMAMIEKSISEGGYGVQIGTVSNIMRIIVEKRSEVDLPATKDENTKERNDSITSSIAEIFPNHNYSHYGEGYIIQLIDGSYIIIDGGENEDDPRDATTNTDSDNLYNYLLANMPSNHEKPVIAAWILSHRHNDHVEVFQGFFSEYHDKVDLEQVIYNFASGVISAPTVDRENMRFAEAYIEKYYPNAKVVTAHTGYKFYIRNVEMTILCSIDDYGYFDITKVFTNNESIAFDMVFDGKQRVMFTNEIFIPGSRALINMYGEDLKSDVIQLSHHGHYGAIAELYQLIWPASQNYAADDKFVLWPIGNEEQRRDRIGLAENLWVIRRIAEDVGIEWKAEWDAYIESVKTSNSYKNDAARYDAIGKYLTDNSRLGYLTGDLWSKIHSAVDIMFENGVTDIAEKQATETDALKAIGKGHKFKLYTKAPDLNAPYDIIIPWPGDWN